MNRKTSCYYDSLICHHQFLFETCTHSKINKPASFHDHAFDLNYANCLTEKLKEKDPECTGSATLTRESFVSRGIPFIVPYD